MNKDLSRLLLPFLLLGGGLSDGLTPTERVIAEEPNLQPLIDEYKLIQQKKSGLSRNQRDLICGRIERELRKGKITLEDLK